MQLAVYKIDDLYYKIFIQKIIHLVKIQKNHYR